MNCTKCGKEIPDGENTLCEDCQKKELEEKEVKTEMVENAEKDSVQEVKEEKKDHKKEKKTENKNEVKKDDQSKNIKIAGAIIAVIIVLAIILIGFFVIAGKNKVGNTIGNIRNYGYAVRQGGWIYYLSPNEGSTQSGIFKVKPNGSGKKELYMGSMDILSMNVVGKYIYFIGISSEAYSEEDTLDNKIYRMKTDGSDLTVINDNEFNDNCYEIYVINNSIYYIGVDANIYKMKLDGSNKEMVAENGTGYLGISDKYIVYNKTLDDNPDGYVTYIMNLDGSNARPIIEGKRLYSINIDGKYIYYTNEEKVVYRTKIDSNQEELITEKTAYNLNLEGKYLYFLNYADIENEDYTVCIYRIKTDGSMKEPENIKQLEQYSSFINLVDGWVLYMDGNDTSAFINMTKVDGKKEVQLYYLNYEEYYENFNEPVNPDLPQDGEDVEPPSDNTGTETPDTSTNIVGNATTPEVSNTASNTAVPENTNSVANTTNTAENVSNTTN